MLVLTRKSNQSIMIGDDIEVSVLSIMGEKGRIGIQAPRDIPVFRKEVYLEIQQERGRELAGSGARTEVDAALHRLGGLELGGDGRVVLGAEVDLVVEVQVRTLGRLAVGQQLVLALEGLDVLDGHLELMSDPGVGTALPDPSADLVEVRSE